MMFYFSDNGIRNVVPMVVILVAILRLSSSVNAKTDPADVSALNVMYASLNSPHKLTKWTSSGGDPCAESWNGIKCSGSRVTEIRLSGLGLSGNLGYQLDKLTSVTTFDVSNNNLGNQIPYQLPPNVQKLNLAANDLTGNLPYSISQMKKLNYLNVSHNQIQGQVNVMFTSLTSLSTMDLSDNSLTGDLPQTLKSLSSMTDMYLQNNQLTGTINVLGNLPLENLNIENNKFSGWIPEQLKGINLKSKGNSFKTTPAPPPPPGTPPITKRKKNNKNSGTPPSAITSKSNKGVITAAVIAGIFVSALVIAAIAFFFTKKKSKKQSSSDIEKHSNHRFAPLPSDEAPEMKPIASLPRTVTRNFDDPAMMDLKPPPLDPPKSFDDHDSDDDDGSPGQLLPPPPLPDFLHQEANEAPKNAKSYSVADLHIATNSFCADNLIGEGSIGPVYRAHLGGGEVVAVKKINSSSISNSEDFEDSVSDISKLQHPNVTALIGYCSEPGQHLLVYEYHKNGSLHEHLHLLNENSNSLAWDHRVSIALGAARALEYLHEVCSPSVMHKNLKSSNILLDMELNPHLSGCGLARLVQEPDKTNGYNAPEVASSGQYTTQSDVYSFAVIMLELLTGRKAFDDSRPRSEQSLVRWATPKLHDIDALSNMVDPNLEGYYSMKSLSRWADVIALCVQLVPEFRPPMSEVVESLVRLVERANVSRKMHEAQGESETAHL